MNKSTLYNIHGLIIFTLLIFISTGTQVLAQGSNKAEEVKAAMWNKKGAIYQTTEVPEKWKNESAVVIFEDYNYLYDDPLGKYLIAETSFHARVKLQDKAAVKEYSEFSFSEKFSSYGYGRTRSKGKVYTGIKVIKPDGKEILVDLDNAVQAEGNDSNSKKIAIPDLLEGDVIDFYFHEYNKIFSPEGFYAFDPVLSTLASSYPSMYQKRTFEVEKNFYINYRSVNGAPEIQERIEDKKQIYTIEAKDIEKREDIQWMYANRSLPHIKFQIIYNKGGTRSSLHFIGARGIIKDELYADNLSNVYDPIKNASSSYSFLKRLEKEWRKSGKNTDTMTDQEIATELYYHYYRQSIGAKLERIFVKDTGVSTYNDYEWIARMKGGLDYFDIASELVVVPSRFYSSLDDLLFLEEMIWLIRVNGKDGQPLYLHNYYLHPSTNLFPGKALGTEAYIADLSNTRYPNWRRGKVPMGQAAANKLKVTTTVDLNEEENGFNATSINESTGIMKYDYQYPYLELYDYIEEEQKEYELTSLTESETSSKKRAALVQNIKDYQEKRTKNRKERLESAYVSRLEVEKVEVHNCTVTQSGRYTEAPFIYETEYSYEGLVKQAGPNLLVNIGMMITGQIEIPESERTREVDIHMNNPRTYQYIVKMTIPEGYSVEGIEQLNFDVKNETGGFTAQAKIEGNQLILDTSKWYAHTFEPKENWEKMLEFLDAANAFNKKEILLRKE